jgi:hypothetical protein
MLATVITRHNPMDPADRSVKTYGRRRRVCTLAPKTHLPFIAILNGSPLSRANNGWNITLKDGDILAFVLRPQGGNGSNPLRLILTIALSLAAPGIGTALAGALGVAGTTVLGISAASLLGGLVSLVGSMVINTLLPSATPGQVKQQNIGAPSPTYSIDAQGNTARLQEPIPVQYGRHISFPDFIADPYVEYSGNEQYLYQLLCLGQGEFDIEAILVEDTPIANFPEVTLQIVTPGQQVTLFPSNVVTSSEVNGQELISFQITGPFVVSSPGTQANFLGFDVVMPKGLFYANDDGGLDAKTVGFSFQARAINSVGAAIGDWLILANETVTEATNTPQRRSYRYAVTPQRYEVRVVRTDSKDTSARAGHDVLWTSARAYLPGQQYYGDLTLIAMRLRATNSLSAQAARRINVISTRKLPIWNGTAWSAPQITRNPAWALADVMRSNYGGKSNDKRLDLAALLQLSATYTTRGDKFDGRFDQHITIFEALASIGEAVRTKPYQQGGVWHFWRDQPQTLPVAMFNMRNIAKGSVKARYLSPTDDTADAIDLEYFDEVRWQWDLVKCKLPDSNATKIAKVRLFGVTGRDQAYREGMYKCAANRLRRNMVTLNTEMEGFIPTYGDLVAVQHDRPRWGQFGDVLQYDAASRKITSSEPLDFSAGGNHYVRLKRRNGTPTAPLLVTAGQSAYEIILAASPPITPYTGLAEEKTSFNFGPSDRIDKLCLVRTIRPRSLETVELSLVVEDAAVHTADSGTPAPSSQFDLVTQITKPVITDLRFTHDGTPENPILIVTWTAAASATLYKIDLSQNNQTWQRVAETADVNYRVPVPVGQVYLRVAPIGKVQGDYLYTGLITTGLLAPPQAPFLQLSEPFIGISLKVKWDKVPRATATRLEISIDGVLKRTINTPLNQYDYTAEDALHDGGPWRTITITAYSIGATALSDGRAITATNPQMATPSGINVSAAPLAVTISAAKPDDSDYAGMLIYSSTTSGFIPSSENLAFKGSDNAHTFTGLTPGVPIYYRIAFFDLFGMDGLNFSSEVTTTPLSAGGVRVVSSLPAAGAVNGDVVSLASDLKIYRWNQSLSTWVTWVDGTDILAETITAGKLAANSIVTNNISAGVVTAAKMNVTDLSAISSNFGSMTSGNITLSGDGYISAGQSAFNNGNGFWLAKTTSGANFSFGNSTQSIRYTPENGLIIQGDVIATGNIKANNVSFTSAVFTSESTNNNSTFVGTNLFTIQSVTIALSTTETIIVHGSFVGIARNAVTTPQGMNYAILINGAPENGIRGAQTGVNIAFSLSKSLGAGSYTVGLAISAPNTGYYPNASLRSLIVSQFKR